MDAGVDTTLASETTQCAAVSTHCAAISEPPQNWPDHSSGAAALMRATCQGASAIVACWPPTIFGVTVDPDLAVADVGATPGVSVATGASDGDGDDEGDVVGETLGVGLGAGLDVSLGVGVDVCEAGDEEAVSAAKTGLETPD